MGEFGIGASVLRKEDDRFLRGRGQYVGDFRMPGMQEVAFVRSPVAHARLLSINIPPDLRALGLHRGRSRRRQTDHFGPAA